MALKDWPERTVMDLQRAGHLLVEDGNHGESRPRSGEFGSGTVAFIRATDMDGGRVLFDTAAKINETARNRINKGVGKGGDVLLSHKGTVGKLALTALDSPPYVCSPQTTFWRVLNERVLDRRYLYYYMRSADFRDQLDSRKGETDMADYVSLTAQRELKVLTPPIYVQQAIARILGTLDDKVDVNRRMNATLEGMARAVFRSWFVDFDPVLAKAGNRRPIGMDAATAGLFPKSFSDSILGPIPRGWRVESINTATSLIIDYRGKTPKKLGADWSAIGIPALSAMNIKDGKLVKLGSVKHVDEVLFEKWMKDKLEIGDTLMTSEAPLGELYFLARNPRYCLSQRVFALRANPEMCLPTYLYHWLALAETQDQLHSRATGTTVQGIRQSELRNVPVLIADRRLQAIAERQLFAFRVRIAFNEGQNDALASLRDTLLPRMLSGELRLEDAKRAVAQAT